MKTVGFIFRTSENKNELLLSELGSPEKLAEALRKKFETVNLDTIDLDSYESGEYRKRVNVHEDIKTRFFDYYDGNRKKVGKACSIIFNQLLIEVVSKK